MSAGLHLGATSTTGYFLKLCALFIKTPVKFTKLHRRNTVLNNEQGEGAPDDWCTEQAQGEPKIMILNIIYGAFLLP